MKLKKEIDRMIKKAQQDSNLEAIALLARRREIGLKEYGQPMQPFIGEDSARHAVEEAADLLVYLKAEEQTKQAIWQMLDAIITEFMGDPSLDKKAEIYRAYTYLKKRAGTSNGDITNESIS